MTVRLYVIALVVSIVLLVLLLTGCTPLPVAHAAINNPGYGGDTRNDVPVFTPAQPGLAGAFDLRLGFGRHWWARAFHDRGGVVVTHTWSF